MLGTVGVLAVDRANGGAAYSKGPLPGGSRGHGKFCFGDAEFGSSPVYR